MTNEPELISLKDLVGIIKLLQSQVNDLRWRMNEVCNFLSIIKSERENSTDD